MKTGRQILLLAYLLAPLLKSYSQDLTSEEIFSKAKDAVVVIYAYDYNGQKDSQGSGVIISEKGIIVTNFHVFAGNEKLEIKHNDSLISYSEIIGVDIEKDILILKANVSNYPNIPLGKTDEVKVGQKIFTIGSPMGFENTMSDGIVSGLREIGEKVKKNYIQITASISPGSSGGAVLNTKGELIGISTMGYNEGQNLNFAVGIDDILGVTLGKYDDKLKLEALNYFFKGQNLQEEGNYSDAVTYLTKYLKIFPNDAKGYNFRGRAYHGKKDFENAIKDFSHAVKIDPAYTIALANRGECYFQIEDYEKALKDFKRVEKLDSENVSVTYGIGLIHSREGDWDEAIDAFTKVIKEEPDYTAAYLNRGIAYYSDRDYEHAIIDWKKCIRLDESLAPKLNPLIDNADQLWQYNVK